MGGFQRRRLWLAGAIVLVSLAVLAAAFIMSTWGEVNRVSIDRPGGQGIEAAEAPDDENTPEPDAGDDETGVSVPPSGDGVDVFLLVGSDSRAELESLEGFGDFSGQRADVVMVLIRPRNGETAAVLSLPRDLLVEDVCSDGEHRLNEALQGCELLNGPSTLTYTVEGLIEVPIDHFAMVDLAGFQEAVDAVGGYEICVERPVRDLRSRLDLPAGCTLASGAQTLAWLRSRSTQELTSSGWRTVSGISDLVRNERQREFMIDMMSRLSDFSSPQDIGVVARSVAPFLTVDSELGLMDAIGLAWTMRDLGESIVDLEIPVTDAVTSAGAAVLIAQEDIAEVVSSYLSPLSTDRSPSFAAS